MGGMGDEVAATNEDEEEVRVGVAEVFKTIIQKMLKEGEEEPGGMVVLVQTIIGIKLITIILVQWKRASRLIVKEMKITTILKGL